MARDFGTNGSITFGAGGAAGTDRNITQVVLAQLTADSAGLMQGRNSTTRRWSFLSSGGSLFAMDDFGTGGNTVLDEDTWYVVAVSKASGDVAYRYHWKELGAGSWTHVNTTDTRVELLWTPAGSTVLTDAQKARVAQHLRQRLVDGTITVVSSQYRSQHRNREAAKVRLEQLVAAALAPRKQRRATKLSRASVERRLTSKRRRSQTKRDRSSGWD
jgi:ribosome-associated protein